MDIYTYLYLADKVDAISFSLTLIGALGSGILTLLTLSIFVNSDNMLAKILSTFITLVFLGVWAIGGLIPSKDFMYQAGAVYLGKEIVKNEQVQETFNKVKRVVDLNLDKQIKKLNGDKN